ncbi:HNH endonuclease [Gordonia phage Daredevil]|uniref:HNH endonuclease n=1 Tax=Gordonia phage Daredevil TaxID=2283286 RepID=A0A345MIW0_9CAUD|nr:HNH endonuclease [Gordonia phage Daredevil]AXH70491.1 HNH endonuclease [Gordonia phage Daredevil]
MSEAEWRSVPDYEGYYEASSAGEIRRLTRQVARRAGSEATHTGKTLRPSVNARGYPQVRLSREGKSKLHMAARVILSAFEGPGDWDDVAVPIDDDWTNLAVDNLTWMSRLQLADRNRR